MDADTIIADADKLKTDRFLKRDAWLKQRAAERFNETVVQIPDAYKQTSEQPKSSIIEDEGQQIGTLVYAVPTPHIPSAQPEDEPLCDRAEKFLIAWFAETEAVFGPIWWQETLCQIHNNLAVEYLGWRRAPYKGQPSPPDGEDIVALAEWELKNTRFKRDAGVASYCDRRFVPLDTFYWTGNIYNPDRVYEIKEVPERDLMDAYGVTRNSDGSFTKPTEPTTTPSGYAQDHGGTEKMIKVAEYWDRKWCVIVAENTNEIWLRGKQVKGGFELDRWEHNWGRVPYFARPARVTDQQDEDKKFAGPLDALYTEMPKHKKLDAMAFNVAYQTAYAPLVIEMDKDSQPILDDKGRPRTFLKFVPGEARYLEPGEHVGTVPQSPEVQNLYAEKAASQARLEHFSLSPVAKGVSPGADTANAALSNLHRFQLSTLDPLAQQASRQASAMDRFVLERIKEMGEPVYVFDSTTDSYLSLAPEDVISVNVQAKVVPDQGQFQLLIEKHAMELYLSRVITLEGMYSLMGKENPSELALDLRAEKYADSLEPVVMQQISSDLGLLDAINAMTQAAQQGGSARDAVPGLMQGAQQLNTGMGQGSEGQPRAEGVRAPVVSQTTQPALAPGGA